MNKFDLMARLSVFVLVAGLISCGKENPKDSFRVPPPVVSGKGELKTWDQRSEKSLDLQDTIEVAQNHLNVVSRCRRGQQSYRDNFSFQARHSLKVFQVIPTALLSADIKSGQFDCGFELIYLNAAGSKHIFQIPSVPLTDNIGGGVQVDRLRFHTLHSDGIRARWRGQGLAEIVCADIKISALSFDNVIEISAFDFASPHALVQENPLQSCRLLIRRDGTILQISNLMAMQFPQASLTTAVDKVINPHFSQKLAFFWARAPLPFALMKIGNPDTFGSRTIEISQGPNAASIEIFNFTPALVKNIVNENFLFADANPRIAIPAGGFALIQLRLLANRKTTLGSDSLAISGFIPFRELDDSGQVLSEGRIEVPRVELSGSINIDEFPATLFLQRW